MPEYTVFVGIMLSVAMLLDLRIFRTNVLKNPRFYLFLCIATILHTIVDNWLNGRYWFGGFIVGPYPHQFFSGIYIWNTPLENYFYGYALILMNVSLFEFLRARSKRVS